MILDRPFAVNGDKEDFSEATDPEGKISLENGWTGLYSLSTVEGGLLIDRKKFNQLFYLLSSEILALKSGAVLSGINNLSDKTTPDDTDNFAIQEVGGDLKKLSFANLKATLFDGAISLTTNGYIKFPTVMSGLIIQWGRSATSGNASNTSFPIAFPTSCLSAVATSSRDTNWGAIPTNVSSDLFSVTGATKTNIYFGNKANYQNVVTAGVAIWLAVGY